MQRMNFYEESVNVSTQTGDENVDIVYHLPNNKKIRLYHSNIYKEKVVSFNINKDIWNEMIKILPQIDKFLRK